MPNTENIHVPEPILLPKSTSQSHTEINDLIGNPPSWLLRSGITMVGIVTVIILGGSYFFKYPDKLTGRGILTSSTPPIEIISRTTGYIDIIHFQEGDEVKKGDVILYINNTTDQSQLIQLQEWIQVYKKIQDPRLIIDLPFVENLQLGAVQGDYANLQLRYNEMQQTLRDVVVFQQIDNLDREIKKIKKLNISQKREMEIYAQELGLSKKDYARNEGLTKEGAVSELDLEKVKTSVLQKERQYEGMNNTIIQNNIRIEQLELEKLKLKQQRSKSIQDYQFKISEILARIESSIENWTKTYTVESPIAGKVTFNKNITTKKNLNQGQIVGHIIPIENQERYISAIFPSTNFGKLKKGQKSILKFDAYPFKEYGIVYSEVQEISKIPEQDKNGIQQYEIRIPVQDIIITDFQDTIQYRPNMSVVAEVVTEDKTVFARIFDQFLSIINNN